MHEKSVGAAFHRSWWPHRRPSDERSMDLEYSGTFQRICARCRGLCGVQFVVSAHRRQASPFPRARRLRIRERRAAWIDWPVFFKYVSNKLRGAVRESKGRVGPTPLANSLQNMTGRDTMIPGTTYVLGFKSRWGRHACQASGCGRSRVVIPRSQGLLTWADSRATAERPAQGWRGGPDRW